MGNCQIVIGFWNSYVIHMEILSLLLGERVMQRRKMVERERHTCTVVVDDRRAELLQWLLRERGRDEERQCEISCSFSF